MAGQQGNRSLDDYVQVHERVTKFRADHPKGRILTTILEGESLTVRAEIYFEGNESTIPNATAHASEDGGMAGRKSSAVEKTETAAVGRALAFCGYEIKQGIASREEMQRAQSPRPQPVKQEGPQEHQRSTSELVLNILGAAEILGYSEGSLTAKLNKQYGGGTFWRKRSYEELDWMYAGLKRLVDEKTAEAKTA